MHQPPTFVAALHTTKRGWFNPPLLLCLSLEGLSLTLPLRFCCISVVSSSVDRHVSMWRWHNGVAFWAQRLSVRTLLLLFTSLAYLWSQFLLCATAPSDMPSSLWPDGRVFLS